MGYLKGILDAPFQQDTEGRTLFSPVGMLGPAYVLRDAAQAQRLHKLYARYLIVTLAVILVCQFAFGALVAAIVGVVLVLAAGLWCRHLLAGCARTARRAIYSSNLDRSARAFGAPTLWVLLLLALLLTAGSVNVIVGAHDLHERAVGALCTLFFAAIAVRNAVMLYRLKR